MPRIAGWGLVTPLGLDSATTWSNLLAGQSIRNHACCSLNDGDDDSDARVLRLARRAAGEALAVARTDDPTDRSTALVVGTSKGPVDHWLSDPTHTTPLLNIIHTPYVPAGRLHPSGVAEIARDLGDRFNMTGPRLTVSAACASGLHALIRGCLLIRTGEARRVLVVAAESSLHPLFVANFKRLGVLPPEGVGCRPFDRSRAGFLMSEAAAAVVLTAGPHREAVAHEGGDSSPTPDTPPIAVERFAIGGDATHLTGGDPDGRVLRRLLADVIDGRPVDLVHAHGTGTEFNDETELAAVEASVEASAVPQAAKPVLYSHKGALGHSLGAAGLVSVVINCLCHRHGVVPPNAATREPMAVERVELSADALPRPVRRSVAMAAGFGGPMAAVALSSV